MGDLVLPPGAGPHPAVVTVFGSGPGGRHEGDWGSRFAAAGFGFYSYDRPGSGESTGDWRAMDFDGRAGETIAAVAAVAAHPAVDPARIALFGGSQGGWVAPLAAVRAPALAVAAVATFSGPGVSPAVQEEFRIGRLLAHDGLGEDGVAYQRAVYQRLREGEPAQTIAADVAAVGDVPWAEYLRADHELVDLEFLRGILDYDPLPTLRQLRCPLLAVFGADDDLVPVADSVRLIEGVLAESAHPDYTVVVFPGADHGIRPVSATGSGQPRAAGFFELLVSWLARRV